MCELFALSSREPTTIRFSFERFARRGGETGPHADGWGVAFFEGRDVQLLREPAAAARSRLVSMIESDAPRATLVISHVRKATRGAKSLANTQPFCRELGGRVHVFAHNGDLAGLAEVPEGRVERYRPIGETDSERAFCVLMDRLAPLWSDRGIPVLEARLAVVREFARSLRAFGPANFLYSDGDALFAHAHRRHHADGKIRPPGLWRLERQCIEPRWPDGHGDPSPIHIEGAPQRVVLVASVPLTDEPWHPLREGELLVMRDGNTLDA